MFAFQVQPEDPPPEEPRLQAASNRVSMSATQLGARPISALNMTSETLDPFLKWSCWPGGDGRVCSFYCNICGKWPELNEKCIYQFREIWGEAVAAAALLTLVVDALPQILICCNQITLFPNTVHRSRGKSQKSSCGAEIKSKFHQSQKSSKFHL